VITCNDRSAALAQIESQKFFPIKIELVAKGAAAAAKPERAAKAGEPEQVTTMPLSHQFLFTEQLGHLLAAGMTLDEALNILERRFKNPKMRSLCQALHRSLVDGRSLSMAMRDFPKIFSPLYVNMIAAGEASGALPEILKRLVVHLHDIKSLRDRVQQALVYPAVLFFAGLGLIVLFMTVMVPRLMEFFSKTGGQLPLATRILLGANHVIAGYWWVAVAAVFGGVSIWKAFTSSVEGRRAWDRFLLNIPGYGHVMRYRYYAQFARTLGTLTENGVTLLKGLELLEEISGNEYIRVKMENARKALVDGAVLSNALRAEKLLPELFLDMMSIGEQTGRFSTTMQNIADVYERELDKQVQVISTLIPPVIMIFIASVVGMVVFGILSAVFSLTSNIGHSHM
jgi:type II secretory pathway component PulF